MKKSAGLRALATWCLLLPFLYPVTGSATELADLGLHVIPYPKEVSISGETFTFSGKIPVILDKNASAEDKFAAQELVRTLQSLGIEAFIATQAPGRAITLTRKGAEKRLGEQGYQLIAGPEGVRIQARGAAGLFYGTQTLVQLFQQKGKELRVPGLKIFDWPDIKERAVHYDTKHHQDKKEYVQRFIRDMARYKINMLVWEWEDKLAYTSHPEIGAPGAFSIEEMQELTRFARQYHIELVPLVQGLGHVSFILKWPQHAQLREIPSSNWEFCPLKEESYNLLFDLWKEAIAATPGSNYIHIGSDETYELGLCHLCKAKSEEIGKSGLYTLFVNKAAKYLKSLGREVMAWERPMGWVQSASPAVGIKPEKGLVLTESYSYEKPGFPFAREAKALGYKVFAYDPNPGIEHLFLPYFYKIKRQDTEAGSLQQSYDFLTSTARSGVFDGMISTSWDDSGLHNQVWMLRFATAAAFSWNGSEPGLDEFKDSFFKNYYGSTVQDMEELYQLFNDAAFYYMSTLERNVWHHGDIGKTHLPDLPRGNALEYDPYWRNEYSGIINRSEEMAGKMQRALQIINANLAAGAKNPHDFEIFQSIASLVWHTTQLYKDLSQLEHLITQAHRSHFESHDVAYDHLEEAERLVESSLMRRQTTFTDLVATWEKNRLPKGLSTEEKKYFFRQDRARHFANRRPDMSYLIYDEQLLEMEGYLKDLRQYMAYYKELYLDGKEE